MSERTARLSATDLNQRPLARKLAAVHAVTPKSVGTPAPRKNICRFVGSHSPDTVSRLENIILTSTPSAARTRRAPRPLRVRSSTRIAAWPLLRAHAALPPEWLWRGRKFYMLAGAGAEEDMSGQYFSLLESEWSRRGACTPQLSSSCTVHTPYIAARR